ncbi:2-succinyl-5-enolpyruvyl-6-hydroxy-3-cyclohexene-1-carboxylic-acid synthase [Actinomyces radicidentis]|uniref:2-succinyl-5-enolpyruvyl-6-hydroxy-3- cyclohexene-1-carboxylic-acid synthase n=1 Tax=Actinomyces radicidentis TaxID=111015 RepID=UPI0028F0AC6A|nr:2-succinyl-5-enolpyruvyl-6-hydroxy-3-cyclohexene-1-carboxylic-acid synthase [Actinomyces radicidentis]
MTSTVPSSIATARDVVTALVSGGVRLVLLAPGSRSAPFVPVLAEAEERGLLAVRVLLDERSAGFAAVGAGRAALLAGERRPTAVITTSGTAVGNLHPAVLEADAAGVPLLIVSADRPHELVGTGANQTTQQAGLFSPALRATVDLPADTPLDLGEGAARSAVTGLVRRALDAATGRLSNDPGPAQVNVRLRPPLAPAPGEGLPPLLDGVAAVPGTVLVPTPAALRPAAPDAAALAGDQTAAERGVIVVGDCAEPLGDLAAGLARDLGWPLLAEPTSGARDAAGALPRYAELLGTAAGAALAGRTEHVLVLGHPSLTRPVSALLARDDIPVDVLVHTARWTDTAGTAARVLPVTLGVTAPEDVIGALGLAAAPAAWAGEWEDAVAALPVAPALLPEDAAAPSALTADAAALAVWRASAAAAESPADPADPAGAPPLLVLGSSMPIRRLDRLAPAGDGAPVGALANRGLAGIDGTLATALGAHLASGRPVRALLGDLTYLHDAMSLSRGRHETEPDLQVVVLDDAGGGIFSTLEYPAVTPVPVMERYFSTPQATDAGTLAEALGARVERPTDPAALDALLAEPVRGLSVVHVRL